MIKSLRFVGLDVHKDSITVAVAVAGREPAELLGTIKHDETALLELLEGIGPKARLRLCWACERVQVSRSTMAGTLTAIQSSSGLVSRTGRWSAA